MKIELKGSRNHQADIDKAIAGKTIASTPGSFSFTEKRAWYTLSAHVSKAPRNPGGSDITAKL